MRRLLAAVLAVSMVACGVAGGGGYEPPEEAPVVLEEAPPPEEAAVEETPPSEPWATEEPWKVVGDPSWVAAVAEAFSQWIYVTEGKFGRGGYRVVESCEKGVDPCIEVVPTIEKCGKVTGGIAGCAEATELYIRLADVPQGTSEQPAYLEKVHTTLHELGHILRLGHTDEGIMRVAVPEATGCIDAPTAELFGGTPGTCE